MRKEEAVTRNERERNKLAVYEEEKGRIVGKYKKKERKRRRKKKVGEGEIRQEMKGEN